ncbi:hypothetical protein Tco_0969523 [Tanacetum coccineum]
MHVGILTLFGYSYLPDSKFIRPNGIKSLLDQEAGDLPRSLRGMVCGVGGGESAGDIWRTGSAGTMKTLDVALSRSERLAGEMAVWVERGGLVMLWWDEKASLFWV